MAEDNPDKAGKRKRAKKARHVGQVIERGENKFLIRVPIEVDSRGKRHYHNQTFHGSKTDAKKLLRDLISKHERGEPLRLSNDTLGVFLDEWLTSKAKLKESSREHYAKTLDLYVRPKFGAILLKKIEARDIDELYAAMAGKYERTTVYFVHSMLKMVFKLAIKRRRLVFNP